MAIRPREQPASAAAFHVPGFLDALGGLVQRTLPWWLWLGRLETSVLADDLAAHPIRMPIFIAGLARSGSTLLHEVVAAHPGVATQRSKDYPLVYTPAWWRRATAGMRSAQPRERLHRDGVLVSADSPDALEEMLWLAFFPHCHDPATSSVLTAQDHFPVFESFYRAHLQKLLLAENATRYVVKANYHVARLGYLLRLFPEARFIIPVRNPVDQVASLLRQHQWFTHGQRRHPRALRYMQRTGHFEFGLDRRPLHLGDADAVRRIATAWAGGDDVLGLAITWAMVYRFLGELLRTSAELRAAVFIARYEDVCTEPRRTLASMLQHAALPEADAVAQRQSAAIRSGPRVVHGLSARELDVIREETAAVASAWGY